MGLGANLGDREGNLARARRELERVPGLRVVAASPVYRTSPQERGDQPWFLNQVLEVEAAPELDPRTLLAALLDIEARLGRIRSGGAGEAGRFGPRTLDLDLLLYGDEQFAEPGLILPHPRMRRRAFVLQPLLDIAPDLRFPDGESLAQAVAKISFQVHNGRITQ